MPARISLGGRLATEQDEVLLTERGDRLVPEETLLPAAIVEAVAPTFRVRAIWRPDT